GARDCQAVTAAWSTHSLGRRCLTTRPISRARSVRLARSASGSGSSSSTITFCHSELERTRRALRHDDGGPESARHPTPPGPSHWSGWEGALMIAAIFARESAEQDRQGRRGAVGKNGLTGHGARTAAGASMPLREGTTSALNSQHGLTHPLASDTVRFLIG